MGYTIKITYTGIAADVESLVAPICRTFVPNNSYVDTIGYEGTVYDTNIGGFGEIDLTEPFASTSIPFPTPLAQFKLAAISENGEIEFEVSDYKEAFYYKQLAFAVADQGFRIIVTDSSVEPDPEPQFVAVTDITSTTLAGVAEVDLTLIGTVAPENATNKTIVWSVKTAGDTGATIAGSVLSTTAAGSVVITATIADGTAEGTDYTKDFTVVIAAE